MGIAPPLRRRARRSRTLRYQGRRLEELGTITLTPEDLGLIGPKLPKVLTYRLGVQVRHDVIYFMQRRSGLKDTEMNIFAIPRVKPDTPPSLSRLDDLLALAWSHFPPAQPQGFMPQQPGLTPQQRLASERWMQKQRDDQQRRLQQLQWQPQPRPLIQWRCGCGGNFGW